MKLNLNLYLLVEYRTQWKIGGLTGREKEI
jgi:hypothetical protein